MKKKIQEYSKYALYICIFCFIVLFLVFIHEFFHALICRLMGGYITSVEWNGGAIMMRMIYPNVFTKKIVCIVGSIGAIIVAYIIAYLAFEAKITPILIASLFYIFVEFLYWTMSAAIGYGDAYWLNQWQPHYLFSLFASLLTITVMYVSYQIYVKYYELRGV